MGNKGVKKSVLSPVILREGKYMSSDVVEFKQRFKLKSVLNVFPNQLHELYQIAHPNIRDQQKLQSEAGKYVKKRMKGGKLGSWVFFPWTQTLIHMVDEQELFLLRTNRNKDLITESEQRILEKSTVGIVGLSIGSAFARNLVQQGIARNLKLAEFDVLETTNMNRIFASVSEIGTPKLHIVTQQLYELDPYWKIHLFDEGLNVDNVDTFLKSGESLDLIFEAIDDLKMKVRIRLRAKRYKIPVVMFTNLGDSVMIDVERYDVDGNLEIFNGLLGDFALGILDEEITPENINQIVTRMVGKGNTPKRAIDSLKLIGKKLVGRPQLAGTVNISGGLASFIARKILLGEELESGRYIFRFNEIFRRA